MRLPGVSNSLAIPMPEQFGTASSLAGPPNSPRLREAHAFGVKILRFAKTGHRGLRNTGVLGLLRFMESPLSFFRMHWVHEPDLRKSLNGE
jgi:hypothetical protein